MATVDAAASPRDWVFVSYSHADRQWLVRLRVLLDPVVQSSRLFVWEDEYIHVGNEWRRDIDKAVARARLAVLLVSGDFLASRFIMDQELPALRARGVRLAPVLIRDCLWQQVPLLAEVQWAHDPGREGPLDMHGQEQAERDRKLTAICRRLVDLVPPAAAEPTGMVTVVDRADYPRPVATMSALRGSQSAGTRVHGLPPLPPGYVARAEMGVVRAALLEPPSRDAAAPAVERQGVGLSGQGGIGKTVLAAALAQEVSKYFPDGVFWVAMGQGADPLRKQRDLLLHLGVGVQAVGSVTAGQQALREALAGMRCLLVVDDVWSAAAASAFRVTDSPGRVLYTGRDPAVLRAAGARVEQVGVFSDDSARALLARLTGKSVSELPAEVDDVVAGTGGVPLALALAGAAVRGGRSWTEVSQQLRQGQRIYGDHPYANVFKAQQLGVGGLDEAAVRRYLSLAVFPSDCSVPIDSVAVLWKRVFGDNADQMDALLDAMAACKLFSLTSAGIRFEDLQHDYLLLQAESLELLHYDLLEAYRTELLPAHGDWWEIPADETYLWENLIHHLIGVGDITRLQGLVTNPSFLVKRAFLFGAAAAEGDLRRVRNVAAHAAIDWWQLWFARHGHLLTGLATIGDVAVTAASMLNTAAPGGNERGLDPLLPTTYLSPVWGLSPATSALRRILETRSREVTALAFSPDGGSLCTGGSDGTLRLWDSDSGAIAKELVGHSGPVHSVAFSPEGQALATASWDGTVRLWDSLTGAAKAELIGRSGPVNSVAFNPDGDVLASGGDDGVVRLWKADTGALRGVLQGHTGAVSAVAFNRDGQLLASAGWDERVIIWRGLRQDRAATLQGHSGRVSTVSFAPDGRLLASAGHDGTLRLWDAARGSFQGILPGHDERVNAVEFSPDGRLLASAGWDRVVRLWDANSGDQLDSLGGHSDGVAALAFAPGGHLLASASWDGTVRLWDVSATGKPAVGSTASGGMRVVASAPDEQTLACGGENGALRLLDVRTGGTRLELIGHEGSVSAVAFSPDSEVLASAAAGGGVRLWNVVSGRSSGELTDQTSAIGALTFSPDGRWLAGAEDNGTVCVWDAEGTLVRRLAGHKWRVSAVAFSPDSNLLASAGEDGIVCLWAVRDGSLKRRLVGGEPRVNAVAFSPEGGLLAGALDGGIILIWGLEDGEVRERIAGHAATVTGVAFTPDGRLVASTSFDKTVRMWSARDWSALSVLSVDSLPTSPSWSTHALAMVVGDSVALFRLVDST